MTKRLMNDAREDESHENAKILMGRIDCDRDKHSKGRSFDPYSRERERGKPSRRLAQSERSSSR